MDAIVTALPPMPNFLKILREKEEPDREALKTQNAELLRRVEQLRGKQKKSTPQNKTSINEAIQRNMQVPSPILKTGKVKANQIGRK
jgi:hypothetical protein